MNYKYIDLKNQKDLIEGVILRKLTIHKDQSGILFETLRNEWSDVINSKMPFKMQYMSQTPPRIARDEGQWHVHKFQKDRFICVSGRIVVAIYDSREASKTKGTLNLFVMGPEKEEEMFMVVIPENTYHGFLVISNQDGYLLNFPTQIYNPKDEGRVHHSNEFSWQKVREDFASK